MVIKSMWDGLFDEWSVPIRIHHPTWEAIETSIRRLDKDECPYVWLFRADDPEEDAWADFHIIGGAGTYSFDCMVDGKHYMYFDATKSDEPVAVWISDQGASVPENHVCYDIEVVLKAARYYCEHGTCDPDISWEEDLAA